MLVRLFLSLRVIALEIELTTKRGLTPVRPSSGDSDRSRVISFSGKPSTLSPAYSRSFFVRSRPSRSGFSRRVSTANTDASRSACGSRCTSRNAGAAETSLL